MGQGCKKESKMGQRHHTSHHEQKENKTGEGQAPTEKENKIGEGQTSKAKSKHEMVIARQ